LARIAEKQSYSNRYTTACLKAKQNPIPYKNQNNPTKNNPNLRLSPVETRTAAHYFYTSPINNNTMQLKTILRQLKSDIFRKDAQQGVTLTYAWMANQFGHFSLGFITAVGLYFIFNSVTADYTLYGALISGGFWFVYEAILFSRTLHKWKIHETSPFAVNYGFLFADLATDLVFFWTGSFLFYAAYHIHMPIVPIGTSVLVIVTLFAFVKWMSIRIHQQQAHLPFAMNLAQWKGSLSQQQVEEIVHFAREKEGPHHMLLFGPRKSAKNNLAVSIANELVSRKKRLYYVSINEFFRMLYENAESLSEYKGGDNLWNWRQCNALIIDHINPGDPVPNDLVNAELAYSYITNPEFGDTNRTVLVKQKVVWVVGDLDAGKRADKVKGEWMAMLERLGLEKEEVLVVEMP